jgi:hypothetical protein
MQQAALSDGSTASRAARSICSALSRIDDTVQTLERLEQSFVEKSSSVRFSSFPRLAAPRIAVGVVPEPFSHDARDDEIRELHARIRDLETQLATETVKLSPPPASEAVPSSPTSTVTSLTSTLHSLATHLARVPAVSLEDHEWTVPPSLLPQERESLHELLLSFPAAPLDSPDELQDNPAEGLRSAIESLEKRCETLVGAVLSIHRELAEARAARRALMGE